MCSDPDDLWSPGCDGSGGYPVNQNTLPSAPVVVVPGPLDDGLEQDEPSSNDDSNDSAIATKTDLPYLLPDGGIPLPDSPVVINNPDPLDAGQEQDDPTPTPIPSSEDGGSPLVTVAGLLLFIQLGTLDLTLGGGIILAANAGPLGWAAELILVPLEITTLGLTIYASQLAYTGTTDHDPLIIWHGFFPDFLPYKP